MVNPGMILETMQEPNKMLYYASDKSTTRYNTINNKKIKQRYELWQECLEQME